VACSSCCCHRQLPAHPAPCPEQVPSAQQPSGLALHSAASWWQQHGLPPGRYPDLLALTRGSKESGGPAPVGLSPKLAKTLLQK
jgi:hypothetical protein